MAAGGHAQSPSKTRLLLVARRRGTHDGNRWSPCRSLALALRPRLLHRRPCSIPAAASSSSCRARRLDHRPARLPDPRASFKSASGVQIRLKNPQRSASSPVRARPVYSSSAARPCPMTRGSSAHAPMSQPASPTRLNKNAVLLRDVPRRMSEASASKAPAPAQTPSMAAIIGCGQARMLSPRHPSCG